MTPTDPIETARTLLRDVQAEPMPGDVTDLVDLLETDDPGERRLACNALRLVAARDPWLLQAELEDDDRLRSLCSDDDPSVRADGADVLAATVAPDTEPDEIEPTLETLTELLDDDARLVRSNALEGLRRVVSSAPAVAPRIVDDVVPFLDAEVGTTGRQAIEIVAYAATVDGAAVRPAASRLLESFRDGDAYDERESPTRGARRTPGIDPDARDRVDAVESDHWVRHRSIRQLAGHALCQLAIADPDAVVPMTDELSALLGDSDPQVRIVTAQTFVVLAGAQPEAVSPHGSTLADRLASDSATAVRASVARALSALGRREPAAVGSLAVEHADALADLLEHDEPSVRGATANLFALAAAADPDANVLGPVAAELETLRDDDVEYVRSAAVDALETGRSTAGSESDGE